MTPSGREAEFGRQAERGQAGGRAGPAEGRPRSGYRIRPPASPVRGVVVLADGLNNRPEAMDGLAGALTAEGFACLPVALPRARWNEATSEPRRGIERWTVRRASVAMNGQLASGPGALAEAWVDALVAAHDTAVDRAGGAPVHVVAYSRGALVAIRAADLGRLPHVSRMVLIAPAVALTRAAGLVRLLTPLARTGVALPSLAPAALRARRGTPLMEYTAMLRLTDAVADLDRATALAAVPTLVVLDRDDELVSDVGVLAWLRRNGLRAWTVRRPRRSRARPGRAHLLVVPDAMGRGAWSRLLAAVTDHLRG